jgi:hypothetical protein
VATRFLSASCPPLYWFAAHLLLYGGGGSSSRAPTAMGGKDGSGGAGGAIGALLWGYCWAFASLGAVMFPNFYPWT